MTAALRRIRHGRLTIVDRGRSSSYGDASRGLSCRVEIHDPSAWASVVGEGSVGLGLSYMRGDWDTDDLVALVRLAIGNLGAVERTPTLAHRATAPLVDRLARRTEDKARDRRNIRTHYDLGNDFFSLFLDPTMTYSCGVFESPDATMQQASVAKLDRLCRKLGLGPSDAVVEIGTGWGSFAIHAARTYGCRVTTTTISDRQYEYARKVVAESGLGDRVTVLNDDYRDVRGTFDALVSIEMIEAVGWERYDTFFAQCARLLRPEGRMALQTIVVADQRYERSKRRNDFIKEVIFPGGCVPSIEAMAKSTARATDLRIVDLEDIGQHYAETLRRWRLTYEDHLADVRRLGLDETFIRMWRFYLAYCEAAFIERQISDVQIVLTRPAWRAEPCQTLPR